MFHEGAERRGAAGPSQPRLHGHMAAHGTGQAGTIHGPGKGKIKCCSTLPIYSWLSPGSSVRLSLAVPGSRLSKRLGYPMEGKWMFRLSLVFGVDSPVGPGKDSALHATPTHHPAVTAVRLASAAAAWGQHGSASLGGATTRRAGSAWLCLAPRVGTQAPTVPRLVQRVQTRRICF